MGRNYELRNGRSFSTRTDWVPRTLFLALVDQGIVPSQKLGYTEVPEAIKFFHFSRHSEIIFAASRRLVGSPSFDSALMALPSLVLYLQRISEVTKNETSCWDAWINLIFLTSRQALP